MAISCFNSIHGFCSCFPVWKIIPSTVRQFSILNLLFHILCLPSVFRRSQNTCVLTTNVTLCGWAFFHTTLSTYKILLLFTVSLKSLNCCNPTSTKFFLIPPSSLPPFVSTSLLLHVNIYIPALSISLKMF